MKASVNAPRRQKDLNSLGKVPKAEFLDTSQGPTLHAGLSKDNSQAFYVNSFLQSLWASLLAQQ